MKNTTTLFVLDQDTPDAIVRDMAEAAGHDNTHLKCLMLGLLPALPAYAYGMSAYGSMAVPDNWAEPIDTARRALNSRVQDLEIILSKSGVSGDVQSSLCAAADIKHVVTQCAQVSDIACIAPNLRQSSDLMRETAYGVLFRSPVGLLLNATTPVTPKRVFVAWDNSAPAARAVHIALPYLKAAQEVVVGCFDPIMTPEHGGGDTGTDVAAWLSHHGCQVTVTQYPSGGLEIGQCISLRAKELGADLIVMGAFDRSRLFQIVFGGTTQTMIEQTDLQVLMAH
ncbi:universal stress protein [Sulfitobacter sp. SK012]|uniref:universal stress protein n=1 Tax=Sulfitobacter sp. SK012 TaxID=1389005 RepID=UPI000E0BEE05|nr:universal stress protein [Sulfitobacter sp. SK012]AXI45248.1 universal stress protein [Sulfitobacter sp. SK012]